MFQAEVYRTVSIYGLTDPRTATIRYVGKSTDPKKRLRKHLRECVLTRNHRECWLKGLLDEGLRPELSILEECLESEWQERERFWIAHLREEGADLTNGTVGGDGPENPGAETRAKIAAGVSKAHLGRKFTPEHKAALSAANKGKLPAESTLAAASAYHTGRKASDETRAKMSLAHMGNKRTPEAEERRAAKRRKTYELISPAGERVTVADINAFCRDHGIQRTNLITCGKDGRKANGWYCPSPEYPEPRASRQGQRTIRRAD